MFSAYGSPFDLICFGFLSFQSFSFDPDMCAQLQNVTQQGQIQKISRNNFQNLHAQLYTVHAPYRQMKLVYNPPVV